MTYLGHCENGVIKLDDGATIAEGVKVRVEVLTPGEANDAPGNGVGPTLYESLKPLAGAIKDWPADFARNHDHYIHGAPKQ